MTTIINIKLGGKYDIYCGRRHKWNNLPESIFHNPYVIGVDGTREEVIEKFRHYAPTNKKLMDSLYLIDDKILGCWCDYPEENCHCLVLIELREKQKLEQNPKKYYTGVGSRKTPENIIKIIKKISYKLGEKGYILRSGGAEGADLAFELGTLLRFPKEIFLPWKRFNNNPSPLYNVTSEALRMAETIHPCWNKLTQGAQKLHARNCYQVLGQDLKTPSKVLICWTENGEEKGGTRTAIVLAKKHNIPVYNLAIEEQINKLLEKLKINGKNT